jgi:16S rRNA G966 N2-methylase RsmD
MSKELIQLSRAEQLLAKAETIPDAKKIADAADALARYLKKVKAGTAEQNRAAAIATKARRKVGEFARPEVLKRSKGMRTDKPRIPDHTKLQQAATYAGVTRAVLNDWQRLARNHTDADIDEAAAKATEKGQEFTTAQMLEQLQEQQKERTKAKRKRELAEAAKAVDDSDFHEVCEVRNCSMRDLLTSGIKPVVIITDPPYAKEFLPLYGELAECAKGVSLLAVMCGHYYLPEILAKMCQHQTYCWTIAYMLPGGQAAQQWNVKVNNFWKPILLFGDVPKWFGDVCASDVNDNDKRFHDWGQSESGMVDLIDRVTEPGQLICDPFCGAGTTGVAAIKLRRRFIGCDTDPVVCETALNRCKEIWNERK